jgi:hypothetical protein
MLETVDSEEEQEADAANSSLLSKLRLSRGEQITAGFYVGSYLHG